MSDRRVGSSPLSGGHSATGDLPVRRSSTPDLDTIVISAARLFHRNGFQNTTMQTIADELGIAKPTLYAHAHSKVYILGQIFHRVLNEGQRLVEKALAEAEPIEGLTILISGQTRLSMAYRDYYGVIYGDQRELPADLDREYRSWSKSYVETVRNLVVRGQQTGAIRSEVDPLVAAHAIIGITGWSARWLQPKGRLSLETTTKQLTSLILDGLSTRRDREDHAIGDSAGS